MSLNRNFSVLFFTGLFLLLFTSFSFADQTISDSSSDTDKEIADLIKSASKMMEDSKSTPVETPAPVPVSTEPIAKIEPQVVIAPSPTPTPAAAPAPVSNVVPAAPAAPTTPIVSEKKVSQPLVNAPKSLDEIASEYGFKPEEAPVGPYVNKGTQMGKVRVWGHYRLAAGDNGNDFILNDANADLQERNFRYLFGERQNNTYDPAVYSQYLLNIDLKTSDKINIYTQLVADPWSWVGTTGNQTVISSPGGEIMNYNLKYFGAFNSTINEIYRTNNGDAVALPLIKIHDGHTTPASVSGFYDYHPIFTIPEQKLDFEFKPIRKLWVDYKEDDWHARIFAYADESQALTTDDPLGLSNHRDSWQQSPWLYQYIPAQHFSDGSMARGYYSDTLSFLARDSEGNRLVLLRGASFEGDFDSTYVAATVASPITPWDDNYFSADNIPGVIRVKHQATDKLMVGGTYGFRGGYIDGSPADFNQALGVDTKYKINEHVTLKTEVAGTRRDLDVLESENIRTATEGYAYSAILESKFDHAMQGHTDFEMNYTQMDQDFNPTLSRYTNTRDDHFWGNHLTFNDVSPNLESFRIGDGVDINRIVARARWRESFFKDKFVNLMDFRAVHRYSDGSVLETVSREEMTYHFTQKLTAKGLFRWQALPKTTAGEDPFLSNFYLVGYTDPTTVTFQNAAIPGGVDPSRFTYSGALQYELDKRWTAEGFYEVSNDVSDFPRGLMNGTFRDADVRADGVLLDHLTNFLYGQGALGGVPPYKYHTTTRQRLIYKPDPKTTITFHAAQNGYKFAGGIDDNINHQGVSLAYDYSKKLSFFVDFTHSMQIDLPNLISSNYTQSIFKNHENVYTSMDYHINAATVLRAEYGVFGMGANAPQVSPYSTTSFSLPTIDTEQIVRVSLDGDF